MKNDPCELIYVDGQVYNQEQIRALLKDKERLDRLERRGVQSIYFNDQGQMNPASMSLRAAIDIQPNL